MAAATATAAAGALPSTSPLPSLVLGLRLERLLRVAILALICAVAFWTRLFSIVRFESIIHEFDPWFNFRATKKIVADGPISFWNWFDERSWYPLGRQVGGTLYPGLMVTAGAIHKLLHMINFPLDIRNICVFMAPFFSMFSAYSLYDITTELHSKTAGLFAAAFMAIIPGYISRSVAGSYDNEAISIFLMMHTFYFWVKAIKTGSILNAVYSAGFYFYMVSAWGGYVFITNLIPLHVFVLLLMGRYSSRIYISYCTWFILGLTGTLTIPVVAEYAVIRSEHMASIGVFGLLQIVAFAYYVRSLTSPQNFRVFLRILVSCVAVAASVLVYIMRKSNYVAPILGRFYTLWDTSHARKHDPIISSVSEHQPTAWSSLFFDLHHLLLFAPLGVLLCFRRLRNEHVFMVLYCTLCAYFAGVMVRLVLTLAPILCAAGGYAIGEIFESFGTYGQLENAKSVDKEVNSTSGQAALEIEDNNSTAKSAKGSGKRHKQKFNNTTAAAIETASSASSSSLSHADEMSTGSDAVNTLLGKSKHRTSKQVAPVTCYNFAGVLCAPKQATLPQLLFCATMILFALFFVQHCTWVTSHAYSSPSVVLAGQGPKGQRNIIDDFREAYYWLRKNTHPDTTVMSWWDYGYQLAGMADRITLVDNNTWNTTHIATVGRAFASNEAKAYPILRQHDVDYVLVIFGGLIGYSGDDINKFLWMIRIAQGVYPQHVSEEKFFTERGEYRVDDHAPITMRASMLYKMSYYRFNDIFGGQGQDRVRQSPVSTKPITFHTVDEAFTSEHWIVRIYKVRKPDFLGRSLLDAAAFDKDSNKRLRDIKVV